MESWIHASKEKGQFFAEEMEFSFDPTSRSKKAILDWDYNLDNEELISDGETAERMGFMDFSFGDTMQKNLPCRLGVRVVSGESVSDICKEVASPSPMVSSNCSLEKDECRSNLWSSDVEAGCGESSLIDLKLGRLTDCKYSQSNRVLKESSVVSSVGSSVSVKRARATGPYPQAFFCQVHGCNKDLSSSKEYHKRHRVCDAHSKTPKVVVNGVEQRFCQQCSRFHLLAEFDDNKRSCRRRLAGHNERRRKSQLDPLSSREHKLLAAYQGARYSGTSSAKGDSLIFSNIVQGGNYYPGRRQPANQSGHAKQPNKTFHRSHVEESFTRSQLHPESYLHCPGKYLNSRLLPSVGDKHVITDAALPVQELSFVSSSGCALSLLSSQSGSGNWSNQSARVVVSSAPSIQGSKVENRVIKTSETSLTASTSRKNTPDELYSDGMNSLELAQVDSGFLSNTLHQVDSKVHSDGAFRGLDPLKIIHSISPEHGSTVDLLQLSSHLQRVERLRNFSQVKLEDNRPFGFLGS